MSGKADKWRKQARKAIKSSRCESGPPPALSHLHVSLQLQQLVPVPRDEARPLVREVHAPETGLPGAQERLADGVVVRPHEVVVDGDVVELHGVAVGAEDLRVAPRGDHQVRVHRALGLVQRVHERTLLVRAELHHVSPHWRGRDYSGLNRAVVR